MSDEGSRADRADSTAAASVISPKDRKRRPSLDPTRAEVGFPVSDFLVTSTDGLGRSISINVTIPPLTRRAATRMIARGLFGFETEADVWRYCLTRGLGDLADRAADEAITSDVALIHAWNEVAKIEMERQIYLRAIENIGNVVSMLVRTGHIAKAVDVAEHAWQEHDKLEDQYWRGVYRTRTKKVVDFARRALAKEREREKERERGKAGAGA